MLKHFIEIMRDLDVWIINDKMPVKAELINISTDYTIGVRFCNQHGNYLNKRYGLDAIFYSESACLAYLKECEDARHVDRMDQLCKMAVK